MSTSNPTAKPKTQQTYEAGCHCGYIKFCMTLSPPLPENKPLQCNCSACRRFGYLLLYEPRENVHWHGASWTRLSRYQFNTKLKDQLFCGKCGASIGIDFRDFYAPHPSMLGISVRTFNGIDLDALEYKPFKGSDKVQPSEDLSGVQYDLEEKQKVTEEDADRELATAARTA